MPLGLIHAHRLGGRKSWNWVKESVIVTCEGCMVVAEALSLLVVPEEEVSAHYTHACGSVWNNVKPLAKVSSKHVVVLREVF